MTPKPGVYRHYKGDEYIVLCTAQDSTNAHARDGVQPPVVVYISLEKGAFRTRDLDEFMSTVNVDGKEVPRFSFVREA